MKFIKNTYKLFLTVLVFISCTPEKTNFTISGTIENTTNEEVSIVLFNVETKTDTIAVTKLVDNSFKLTGNVEKPTKVLLFVGHKNIPMILENDNYTVVLNKTEQYAKGGKLNQIVYGYLQQIDYQKAKSDAKKTAAIVFKDIDWLDKEAVEVARAKNNEKTAITYKIQNKYMQTILEGDYSELAKIYTLSDNYDWKNYDVDTRIKMFETYNSALNEPHPIANEIIQSLTDFKITEEKKLAVAPGKPFKDVVAKNIDNEEISLSETIKNNKYTLLEFWASWCGPCRGEFPHLKKAYKTYNPKGFEIYGLSLDEKEDRWLKALKEENTPWINVVDFKHFESDAAIAYFVQGIPASFLIANDGKIVASGDDIRGFSLDEKLEELFR